MDVVRTLTCVLIIEGHVIKYIKDYNGFLVDLLAKFLLGVVFVFFILSSFGLTVSYYKHGIPSCRKWYYKRFMRVVPPYWAVVVAYYVMLKCVQQVYPSIEFNYTCFDLTMYILLLRNFVQESWWMFEHLWFIPVIVGFYIIFPVMVAIFDRIKSLKFFLLSLLVSFSAISITIVSGHPFIRQNAHVFYYLPLFAAGMTAGYGVLYDRRMVTFLTSPYAFLIGCVCYVLSALMGLSAFGTYNDCFTGIGSFLILFSIIHWCTPHIPAISTLLKNLSTYTYLAYLIHLPLVVYIIIPLFNHYAISKNVFFLGVFGIINAVAVFALAKLLYSLYYLAGYGQRR